MPNIQNIQPEQLSLFPMEGTEVPHAEPVQKIIVPVKMNVVPVKPTHVKKAKTDKKDLLLDITSEKRFKIFFDSIQEACAKNNLRDVLSLIHVT